MLRVILDVNLLVSAAITPKGEARAILNQARVKFNLLLSDFIFQKVEQVLRYPHIQAAYTHLARAAIAGYLTYVRGLAIPVDEITSVSACPDPEDNRILAAAVDGQADYLVTRNLSHFPSTHGHVRVVSPADFHRLIRQAQARQ